MAFNKITEKPEVTVKKSDLDVLITQTETVGGENVVALRRMKAGTFLAELTADISSLDSADIMLAMDGYISPTINGIKNYRDGNVYHKKIGRVDLGSLDWRYYDGRFYCAESVCKTPTSQTSASNCFCNIYSTTSPKGWYEFSEKTISALGIGYGTDGQIGVIDSTYSDATTFKSAMQAQGIYLYYELATEITRNIDGNEITVVERNAGAHNSIYRGRYLGSAVTDAQYTAIAQGTFDDLYIGDYWTIGGVNWRIADFDYWYQMGDTACTTHHVVVVPDSPLYNYVMNDTNVTTGAYVGSKMYTSGLNQAKSTAQTAFGSGHILSHRVLLQNATTNGYASGNAWYDSTVDLMTEEMVYGAPIFEVAATASGSSPIIPSKHTVENRQLKLFALDPQRLVANRNWWWLRSVVGAVDFAFVYAYGYCDHLEASFSGGVRPAIAIK